MGDSFRANVPNAASLAALLRAPFPICHHYMRDPEPKLTTFHNKYDSHKFILDIQNYYVKKLTIFIQYYMLDENIMIFL